MSEKVFVDYIRDASGAGVPGALAEMKHGSPATTIDSMTTGSDGKIEFTRDEIGYPGATWLEASKDGITRKHTGESIGQVGAVWMADFIRLFRMMTDGVVSGVDNNLAVSADNTGMYVSLASGLSIGYGLPYYQPGAKQVAIAPNASGNPRIDSIVIRYYPATTTDPTNIGRIDRVALQGTPAASPVAPSRTANPATYWEVWLADVLVNSGVSAIAADKVTDRRTFSSGPLQDNSVTSAKIAAFAVTLSKIAANAVSNAKLTTLTDFSTAADAKVLKASISPNVTPTYSTLNLSELADVTEDVPTAGQALLFDGTANKWKPGVASTGDTSSNTASSVDSEIVLFNGTSGKSIKRATQTGVLKASSGVIGVATGTDLPAHTHSAADVTAGTLPVGRGGTGATTLTGLVKGNGTSAFSPAGAADMPSGIDAAKLADGSVSNTELQYLNSVTSNVQNQIDGKAALVHTHSGADITSGTVPVARLPTAIPATSIGAGTVDNTKLGYLSGVSSDVQTQLNGKSATTHTHTQVPVVSGHAENDYTTPVSITTSGQTVASVNLTLLNGVTYDVFCLADMQGNAPASGYIQAFAQIISGGSDAGTKTGTPSGERPISAMQAKTVLGTGVAIACNARANTSTGSGSVNGAQVRAWAIPRDVPAS